MSDLTLQQLVLRLLAAIFIAGVHGIAVASAACALGDPGPRYDGRLRVNPLVHIDLLGLVSGVLFLVGWSKPVTIDPKELRLGRFGLVVVVLAAAAATLGAVMVLRLARPRLLPLLGDSASVAAFALIETIGQLGLWFALINLVPLPPFTGSHILAALAPHMRDRLRRVQPYAALCVLGLGTAGLFVPGFAITRLLDPAYGGLARFVIGD